LPIGALIVKLDLVRDDGEHPFVSRYVTLHEHVELALLDLERVRVVLGVLHFEHFAFGLLLLTLDPYTLQPFHDDARHAPRERWVLLTLQKLRPLHRILSQP